MMTIPSLRELVGPDKKVTFSHYKEGSLWYQCDNGFSFPVPISDTDDAMFLAKDNSVVLMRWIRRHLKYLEEVKNG